MLWYFHDVFCQYAVLGMLGRRCATEGGYFIAADVSLGYLYILF
jgi:hypothetical protein